MWYYSSRAEYSILLKDGHVISALFKHTYIYSCPHRMIYMQLTPQYAMETFFKKLEYVDVEVS